jgi:hypothetical protein
MPWTPESVLALAPDPSSAKSGQALAAARQWQGLGRSDLALWGEIKGSGSTPYQTRIDLREPAFKCSCPSRKFPCKHGIGLLLVFAKEPTAFQEADPPAWVADWLGGREQRAEKKAEKAAAVAAAPPDPEAQKKRADQREARITEGLEQLHLWLADLLRAGFAQAQSQPSSFWDAMGARLVDAQAPGLARLVRGLEAAINSGPGWEQRLLHGIASTELVRRAYVARESLPAELVDELRAAVGWTTREEDVLASAPALRDRWFVLGSIAESEERLRVRRTWLRGRSTGRPALLLDFAVGAQPLAPGHPPGCEIDAELVFYPGSLGLRATVKSQAAIHATSEAIPGAGVEGALAQYADALARAPWLERWPMTVAGVVPVALGQANAPAWHLVDGDGKRLALAARFGFGWHLLAISGGRPVEVFGEWDGAALRPLAVSSPSGFHALGESIVATREAAPA